MNGVGPASEPSRIVWPDTLGGHVHSVSRDQTIDLARGIAIVTIVVGHVLGGLGSAGMLDPDSAGVISATRLLYTFHFYGRAIRSTRC
jgi:uncharacterized membrane protein